MFDALAAPFPKHEIHWRAQNITKEGDKALALAYIDARDVMRRLDEVVGAASWQDRYVETHSGRVICTLSILLDDAWVSKSDGAGDTAVEGEKGALSDAFKRAAVKWGIGRYLYALPTIWVPCETWTGGDGKMRWKKWTADPWSFVLDSTHQPPAPKIKPEDIAKVIGEMQDIWDVAELGGYWTALAEYQPGMQSAPGVIKAKDKQKAAIEAKASQSTEHPPADEDNGMTEGGHL